MAETRYGRYILREAFKTHQQLEGLSANGDEMDCDCILTHHVLYQPEMMLKQSHVHDFTQLLCFLGTNPMDVRDFGGCEIDICLGEEQEQHLITAPVIVTCKPGLWHGPLDFRHIPTPVIFLEIMLTRRYHATHQDGSVSTT